MVSIYKFLSLFFLISFPLMAQDVVVTSEMNYTQLFAGSPLTGSITVTHNKNELIDVNSFKLGTKPLKASFIKNVPMSETSPLIVSIYSFEIATLPKGLHVLPEVSVKVGNKTYKSYSTTFEVFAAKSNQEAQTPTPVAPTVPTVGNIPVADNPELLLKALVEGPSKLYPGQQTKFIYKFLYRGHIDLTKEVLPLLEAAGLKKVGDKQTKDYTENNLNVSEFSQVFEGEKPGTFEFGPSIIEGKAFTENERGEKVYGGTLNSEAPTISIQVLPFPDTGKPTSFNGAIGNYILQASLNGSKTYTPGEKLTLLLEITGDPSNFSTLQAPDLCCQPGFSGMFKPSDLPPISSRMGNTKRFLIDLTPLSSNIKEIPPIEFSSFDPSSGKYLIVKSDSIPLTLDLKKKVTEVKAAAIDTTPAPTNKPLPIEIASNENLTTSDLHNKLLGTWWNILWVPVFAVLFLTEQSYKKEVERKKLEVKEKSSEELFKEAINESGTPNFYSLIQQAFIKALAEKGEISNKEIEPENLSSNGLAGDVKIFLTRLNEVRFSGNKKFDQAIISSAKELFGKIKGTPK